MIVTKEERETVLTPALLSEAGRLFGFRFCCYIWLGYHDALTLGRLAALAGEPDSRFTDDFGQRQSLWGGGWPESSPEGLHYALQSSALIGEEARAELTRHLGCNPAIPSELCRAMRVLPAPRRRQATLELGACILRRLKGVGK